MYSNHLPQFDRGFRLRLCMFFCHALVPLPCPFDCSPTSHLLSHTASVEQAALSYLYVPFLCCFGLCAKTGVDRSCEKSRVALHRVADGWKGLSWNVWLLTLQDSPNNFTFAGNAFKITGATIDIDDLKKVLRNFIHFVSEQVSEGQ